MSPLSASAAASPPAAPPAPAAPADLSGTTAHDLCLVVAPGNGRFQPEVRGGTVAAGAVVAHITGGGDRRVAVRSPAAVVVHGLLARPGGLVTRGQALAWGRRVASA